MDQRESEITQVEATEQKKQSYILNERPEGMTFELYKAILKHQNKALHKYKKGKLIVSGKNTYVKPK